MAIFLPLFFIIPLVLWLIWRTIVLAWTLVARKKTAIGE